MTLFRADSEKWFQKKERETIFLGLVVVRKRVTHTCKAGEKELGKEMKLMCISRGESQKPRQRGKKNEEKERWSLQPCRASTVNRTARWCKTEVPADREKKWGKNLDFIQAKDVENGEIR